MENINIFNKHSLQVLLKFPACVICFIWMVYEIRGKSLYSCCFEEFCFLCCITWWMNDEWRNHNTFLYQNITISTSFLERVEIDVSMRERERERETKIGSRRHTEDLKDLDTAILTLIFFLAMLCHTHSFT